MLNISVAAARPHRRVSGIHTTTKDDARDSTYPTVMSALVSVVLEHRLAALAEGAHRFGAVLG
jgi:hypothetical protein